MGEWAERLQARVTELEAELAGYIRRGEANAVRMAADALEWKHQAKALRKWFGVTEEEVEKIVRNMGAAVRMEEAERKP